MYPKSLKFINTIKAPNRGSWQAMTVTPLGNYELKLDLSIPSVIDEEGHDDQVEQTGAQRFYEEGFAPAETAKSPAGRGSEVDLAFLPIIISNPSTFMQTMRENCTSLPEKFDETTRCGAKCIII